jgi:hypothetical protein
MNRKIKMKIYSIEMGMTPNTKSSVTRFCVHNVTFSLHTLETPDAAPVAEWWMHES